MTERTRTVEMDSKPVPELLWRAQISGLLRDLTKEVLALTEVVLEMSKKLDEQAKDEGAK